MFLYFFLSFLTSLQDGWSDFKVCKNVLKWENHKKFAVIVSQEQTGLFSRNFRHSYRYAWILFDKNKETVNIIYQLFVFKIYFILKPKQFLNEYLNDATETLLTTFQNLFYM